MSRIHVSVKAEWDLYQSRKSYSTSSDSKIISDDLPERMTIVSLTLKMDGLQK